MRSDGDQVRTTHYYEPTYSAQDLPERTDVGRDLPGVDLNEAEQLAFLDACRFGDQLRAVPLEKTRPDAFGYRNESYSFGDAEMLYNFIRVKCPARIVEIGSGHSTLMARIAIEHNQQGDPDYACEHVCIEPYEMPWLESIGVRVIREKVEDVGLEISTAWSVTTYCSSTVRTSYAPGAMCCESSPRFCRGCVPAS